MIQLIRTSPVELICGDSRHSDSPSSESLFARLAQDKSSDSSFLKTDGKRTKKKEVHWKPILEFEKSGTKRRERPKAGTEYHEGVAGALDVKESVPPTSLLSQVRDDKTPSPPLEYPSLPTESEFLPPVEKDLTFLEICYSFLRFIKDLGIRKLLWATFLSFLVIGGQAMQLIFLNFWLREYPESHPAGNYTTFFISSLLFPLFFIIWLIGYFVVKRPKSIRFMRDLRGLTLLFGIGSMDTINSILATYSANHANEVLEAVFTSVGPPLTAAVSRIFLNERRPILNPWFLLSLSLVVGGVFLASGYAISHSEGFSTDTGIWTFLFFLSIPPNVFLNCWQARYLILFTKSAEFEKEVVGMHVLKEQKQEILVQTVLMPSEGHEGGERVTNEGGPAIEEAFGSEAASNGHPNMKEDLEFTFSEGEEKRFSNSPTSFVKSSSVSEEDGSSSDVSSKYHVHYPDMQQSNDMLVKLWMLVGDTGTQFLQTMILLPADAIPWWGGSATVQEAGANLGSGLKIFFTYKYNFLYGALYSAGFIFTYIGSAYLNQYSVTLCSMVTEISSPITALLLLLIPSINLSGSPSPLSYSLSAVVILSLGTILYTIWDYSTKAQKERQEFRLKYRNVKTEVIPLYRSGKPKEECAFPELTPYVSEDSSSFLN